MRFASRISCCSRRVQRKSLEGSERVRMSKISRRGFVKAAALAGTLYLLATPGFAQQDPGVRGGVQNTSGMLEFRGIPIPHPPVISPNPTTSATITANELALFNEGINRALWNECLSGRN